MAGSYKHLLGKNGGIDMIENMGDAVECIEELFWLVESEIGREKALKALDDKFYPESNGVKRRNKPYLFVQSQMTSKY